MIHDQTQLRTSASLLAHGGQALKHGNKIDHQTPFFVSSLLARLTARPFYSNSSGGFLLPLPDGKAGDHVLRIASQILHPAVGRGLSAWGRALPNFIR